MNAWERYDQWSSDHEEDGRKIAKSISDLLKDAYEAGARMVLSALSADVTARREVLWSSGKWPALDDYDGGTEYGLALVQTKISGIEAELDEVEMIDDGSGTVGDAAR